MKTKATTTLSILLLLVLAFTTSCQKDPIKVPPHTEAWLQTKSDTKLTFTSHTGDSEEIRITVKKDTHTYSTVNGDRKIEYYYLDYAGTQSNLGFGLLAEENTIIFRNSGQEDFYQDIAILFTDKDQAKEWVNPIGVEAELINNLTLGSTTYSRLLRIKFNLPTNRPDKIKEIYYAKNHGLVYFQTTDGKFWTLN